MQSGDIASTSEERDINDVFEDILLTENRIFEEGFKEGFELGKKQDNIEAFHLGYHRGAEIGAEIGYYSAVVESYLVHRKKNNTSGDDKLTKQLTNLKQILADFPRDNDPNVDILGLVSQIRAKFKKICAILKIHPTFPQSDDLTF